MRPELVKKRETLFPWSARRAMDSAETRLPFLRMLFIEFLLLARGAEERGVPHPAVFRVRVLTFLPALLKRRFRCLVSGRLAGSLRRVIAFARKHFQILVHGFHLDLAEGAVARGVRGIVAKRIFAAQFLRDLIEGFL